MNPPADIKAVIFDMDGVLCDSEPFILKAAQQILMEIGGKPIPAQAFQPFVGAGEDRYIGGPAEACGIDIDLPKTKARVYQRYQQLIVGQLQPLPGVDDFIAHCKATGRTCAVASSADLIKVKANLTELGLPFEQFNAVVTGSDVTCKKPDPEAFLLAAQRLNTPPANCMVVEDAVNGVTAAIRAGMYCLALTTSFDAQPLKNAGAHWLAPHLAELPEALTTELDLP